MNLERYPLKAEDDFKRFEFYSVGPKGRIKKVVQFQEDGDPNFYNLALGDWEEVTGEIKYDARSNNGDLDKVMASVASAVFEFMLVYSNATVFAEGSTAAKTRLYQMGISKHLSQISLRYCINGWLNNNWVPFERGKNYEAFYLQKKKN
jgi:hypothetical protein